MTYSLAVLAAQLDSCNVLIERYKYRLTSKTGVWPPKMYKDEIVRLKAASEVLLTQMVNKINETA